MIKDINLVSILVGSIATQAISAFLALIFVIACFFVYGNNAMVAALEYPSSIAVTMLISLAAVFLGGFITMLISNKSLNNTLLVGLLYLFLNIVFLYSIDFVYAQNYRWMLVLTAVLTIPATVLGGYVYKKNS